MTWGLTTGHRFAERIGQCGPHKSCQLTHPKLEDRSRVTTPAQVAELVDALASGASVRMDVEVRVLSWAPFSVTLHSLEESQSEGSLTCAMAAKIC